VPGIALVLGAGGSVGHAFHAGVLAGVRDATGWDARDAALIVGTSAGSVVGALLRADLSPADLANRWTGGMLSPRGRRIVGRAEANSAADLPSRARRGMPMMSAPGAFLRAALQPWTARPGALAAAAMPEGHVDTELIAASLRPLFEHWPERPLWINAVALDSGRRVTFGRGEHRPTDVATAVAASCAIPSYFAPVHIDGVRYVDGGVHSPTNADLVAPVEFDLVVVSSPMSVAARSVRLAADQPARRLARLALAREVARVRRGGVPVITFQPTAADLAVMGLNAMDASRGAEVTTQVRASAARRLERPDAQARAAVLRTA
jgi:NTE family protein